MALDTWMPVLKTKLAEISGIVQVHKYDELPGSIVVFPSILITLRTGHYEYSVGGKNEAEHDIQLSLFVSAQILPEAHSLAASFIEPLRAKLAANIKLGATIERILPTPEGPTYQGPGQITYADKLYVGVLFFYRVYENETGLFPVSA